ncbi:pyridoxamine 5'-phosphate oxidase family protein [Natronorubrum tibetense]|uniref:Flavin-nucleotide-binding protein-like protein n=1 Tax=Natronorubrum tibetense GA33 TaxID=1114856 RepID=L9VZ05_9EURY|nr:pyridoxamine 5'-phosphate oxidase family protein [Natronorubrum tibetense]ELY42262.1 flavin-nucleotide-binding protein-like protein [Natronorubrum tibetense GA33]
MSIDELREYGLEAMNDREIQQFLSSQKVGVLGLPDADEPYLLPLSFGYDGEERLYFTYLLGSSSRKGTMSEETDTASFLVYKVDTMYNWQSVLLTGALTTVPEAEWDELEDTMSEVWRPDLIETASLSADVELYEFRIREQTGVKHQGLPPGFKAGDDSR